MDGNSLEKLWGVSYNYTCGEYKVLSMLDLLIENLGNYYNKKYYSNGYHVIGLCESEKEAN